MINGLSGFDASAVALFSHWKQRAPWKVVPEVLPKGTKLRQADLICKHVQTFNATKHSPDISGGSLISSRLCNAENQNSDNVCKIRGCFQSTFPEFFQPFNTYTYKGIIPSLTYNLRKE